MFDGHRNSAIAAGLTLIIAFSVGGYILGHGLGEQTGEYKANTDTYAKHAQDEINSTCGELDGPDQTKCIVRVVEATNEHERSESDLSAQRNMAQWALLMLLATVAMSIVTALGVYYVWRTLVATQQMSIDAKDIGRKQARAYVHVSSTAFEIIDKSCAAMTVSLHNSGISPAVDVSIMAESFFDTYPLTNEISALEHHQGYRTSLGPGGELSTVQRLRGDIGEAIQKIETGLFAAYIHGHVEYEDVFGEKRFVSFLYAYGGRLGDIGPNFHAYEVGNESD